MDKNIETIAKETGQKLIHVENVVKLLDEGNTVPFIARYRKEMHGTMDDQLIREISERMTYLRNLDKRRDEVTGSIEEQGKMTEELMEAISGAKTLAELEDIYRPYKQKRRTRATVAKEKGLEPLADSIYAQNVMEGTLEEMAAPFVSDEKGVEDVSAALAGASDIIAENISDDAEIRRLLKELIHKKGRLASRANTEEDTVYRNYYDFSEAVSTVPSHRILAINRGEDEKVLRAGIDIDEDLALNIVRNHSVKQTGSISCDLVREAADDSYRRLIFPSIEREIRSELTDMASEQAIRMFGLNLKPLLMQPPVRNMVTMGFDPAYRTGCKIAVVDETGKVLDTGVVYPTPPHNKKDEARAILTSMIRKYNVKAIAIGNGTASKESEIFIAGMLKELPGVAYMVVNEAGASVYSASKLGAAEFPQYDVSLRSAVSIARRLQDPLAELVKIDPKSIGVGQYQHDMPQARLDETLSGAVEDCVNAVGVDLNTASPSLLARVAGLNATTARNIVHYREENGIYKDRKAILKVPKIGPKAFEQAAGFLRVPSGNNVLDNTGVHPESYEAAVKLLDMCGYDLDDVKKGQVSDLRARLDLVGAEKVAAGCGVGVPTITDIASELTKPGRDPRDELPPAMLRTDVMGMEDLKPGMEMRGTVRNVTDFGCFVDIGVHQDGLVHISEIANRFIKHPSEAVKVGDVVNVVVLGVDVQKKRISLSIKQAVKNGKTAN
ncbi:MAG: RNA-binding transcriptional accessory protein [Oscillospiraceae bacterium]|nr:RNA-binding transcriptional accessory protein [Oscillospiraceae bacterium]MBQ3999436.1 RNA-binding transcriptional accessory protein [Oscillospiraceae bacterium]